MDHVEPSAELTAWQFQDGVWTEIPDPITQQPGEEYSAAMHRAGFHSGEHWGHLDEIELFVSADGSRWVVDWCVAAGCIYSIHVARLPDLLDLLHKITAIATASLLSQLNSALEQVVINAARDAAARS